MMRGQKNIKLRNDMSRPRDKEVIVHRHYLCGYDDTD